MVAAAEDPPPESEGPRGLAAPDPSRSLFATLIPKHKAGEMFGFFGVFDRFGGAIGSFVFGVMLAAIVALVRAVPAALAPAED